jgi:tetratricopeptide (TPR) repeat protein
MLAQRKAWTLLVTIHAYLGEYDASERAAQHAEALLELTGDDPDASAVLLNALAFSRLEQSKFDEALELELAAVEVFEAHDENNPRMSSLLNSLGTMYTLVERNEDALVAYERAYDLALAQYGAYHEAVANAMFALGRVEARLDDLEESNRWYEQAIALYAALGASDSVAAIFALGNLGQNYGDQGQYPEAMATTEQSIAAMVRKVGPTHRYLVRMRRGLAEIYLDAGEIEKAVTEGEHALRIAEATFGDEHDETASTRRRLGQILLAAGERARAIELLERALQGHSAPATPPVHKAISQYWLFVALRDDETQRARARTLAESAIGPLAQGEARDRARAEELRAWLDEHRE